MNMRENFFRVVEFKCPEWIPVNFAISPLYKEKYGKEVERIMKDYPLIFERHMGMGYSLDFSQGDDLHYYKGYFLDHWGSIWRNIYPGLKGQVIRGPLEDWNKFKTYKPPDPFEIYPNDITGGLMHNWKELEENVKNNKEKGFVAWGNGERLFDRLFYLRGFENLMIDFATENPNLSKLIEVVHEYEKKLINKWISIGVDALFFHTDMGSNDALMISPQLFRKYLKPMFKDLFTTCRNAGVHVYLSSDGKILEIIDDLIECGVSTHDVQLGPNSLDEIEKYYKGKMTIYLDLDRQKIPFIKPDDVKEMIKKSVERLNSPKGGFMILVGIYDDIVPIENIEAICQGIKEFVF